ncbi:MAG TPA: family 43 glycosylhydrolase [Actinoplanes sp.]
MKISALARRRLVAGVAVPVVVAAASVVVTLHANAAAGCSVRYAVTTQWSGGFTADIAVTNLGFPLTGWTVTWSFDGGQTVSQGWNATFAQSGATVTARNASWNAPLPTDATVTFGFNGANNGITNPAPTSIALDGVTCTGSAAPSGTPTFVPTAEPTTPPTAPTSAPTTVPGTTAPTTAPSPTPTSATPAATFVNPIKRNGPDPWLQYYDGYYYLATTTWNSTITMRRSATLAGLANATETTVFNLAGRANGCCNMWAPEFHLINGHWYLYYVAGQNVTDYNPTQRLHVLESSGTDPMGPYTFKADLGNDWQLDASVLTVGANLYLMGTYGGDGAGQSNFIQRLSNPYTLTGSRVRLSAPTYDWEKQTGAVNEGPEPLYHDGKVMVVYSASACWGPDYKLGLLTLTGTDPMNPAHWTKKSTPVFQRNDANGVYAPGHNGFFKSPDGTEDWLVYHANSSASGGCDMNRSTRAQKFSWNADGTPNFGSPVSLSAALPVPSGE